MRTLATVVLALSLIPGLVQAQSLAQSIPDTVVAYFHQDEPMSSTNKLLGNNGLWKSPVDMQKDFLDVIDSQFGKLDGFLGIDPGSISTYLKSIKSFEGVLFSLQLTDSFPEIDWAVVIDTPQAEKILQVFGGMLVDNLGAEKSEDGTFEMSFGGEMGLAIARREDKIVIAGNQGRIKEVMSSFGSVKEGGLVQSKLFKEATGGIAKNCLYVRLDTVMKIAREEMPRRIRERAAPIMEALGIFKMAAAGWAEGEKNSRMGVLSHGSIPLFDIPASPGGDATLLAMMPVETVFGMTWRGDAESLWKKGSSFFLDASKFPMADRAEEGIRVFQKETGLKVDEIVSLAKGGIGFGFIPGEFGRLDDRPENFLGIIGIEDPAQTRAILDKLVEALQKRGRGEVAVEEDGGTTWFRIQSNSSRPQPCVALTAKHIFVGTEPVNRRLLAIQEGQHPSLGSTDALKGLKPKAAAHMFLGLKGIFGNENELTAGYHNLRDGAGIAASMEIMSDRVIVTTNRPVGEAIMTAATAGAMQESSKAEQRRIRQDLEKIAKAYREYRGNQGKSPTSLSELGFDGDKALKAPNGKPYTLISVKEVSEDDAWNTIVAYCPDTRYGRLVAVLSGNAMSYSESRFQRAMAEQSK